MQHRANQTEEVENGVKILLLRADGVQHRAYGVRHAARHEQHQARVGEIRHQRFGSQQNHPAQRHIADDADFCKLLEVHRVQHNACNRDSPHDAEHYPASRAAQRHQRVWRVRSSNQQENCAVVEHAKDFLRAIDFQRVI